MNQLLKLKESVATYLTPVKRQRTGGLATPDDTLKAQHAYHPSLASQVVTPVSFFSRFSRKPLSPPDTAPNHSHKRPREDDDEGGRNDTSTTATGPVEAGLASSDFALPENDHTSFGDDEPAGRAKFPGTHHQLSTEAEAQEHADREALFALRQAAVEDARASGKCHEDELYLYERLSMLCFEPILPAEWQIDFPTLPLVLFTEDENDMYFHSNHGSDSRAIKALRSLLDLGFRLKEKVDLGKPTDRLIVKEIQNYITWAEVDGGYSKLRFIPILTIVSARPHEDSTTITNNLAKQMDFLAHRHREHLALPPGSIDKHGKPQLYRRTPPLIYGIIVALGNVFFCTLDSANPDAKPRHQTHYNMLEKDKEVWNGFAIAILIIMVRDYMTSIVGELEVDEMTESDPDA